MATSTEEAVQHYTVTNCLDATTAHRTGTVEVIREDPGDNLFTLIVDDGQGGQAAVVLGWREAVLLMQSIGAVAVHM